MSLDTERLFTDWFITRGIPRSILGAALKKIEAETV
jgi:hypothetical protein